MNKEQILTLFGDVLSEKNILKARGFDERSFRPHQFMVGAKHQIMAEKENEGILSEEILQKIPCEHIGCMDTYEEHTSDKVLILQLTRDATHQEVNDELVLIKPLMYDHDIKQAAFADTLDKFKFVKDENRTSSGESLN